MRARLWRRLQVVEPTLAEGSELSPICPSRRTRSPVAIKFCALRGFGIAKFRGARHCDAGPSTDPEQQDFSLGTPNVVTGLGEILDPNGAISDSLDFYLNADGNVHVLFQSDGFAQTGGVTIAVEDTAGNWFYNVGNIYQGNSPNDVVPEPSSLILLGSGILGIAGVVRRRFL